MRKQYLIFLALFGLAACNQTESNKKTEQSNQ
jgi:hypothetical protein